MNIAEAGLLDRSFGRLNDTLLNQRMLEERRKEREEQLGIQREQLGMRRDESTLDRRQRAEELGMRRDESTLDRRQRAEELGLRREELGERRTEREANAKSLEDYRRDMLAAKTDDQKFGVFQDLLKSGAATQETLDNMSKAMSEKLGVQVILKMPAQKGFDTREGHNLALAEKYRERAAAAQRTGAGDVAERFTAIADRLERGGTAEAEPMAEITTGGGDDLQGNRTPIIRRKISQADLEREIQRMPPREGGATNAPAAPGAPGAANVFNSEQEARASGHKAGDVVTLQLNGKPTRVRLK